MGNRNILVGFGGTENEERKGGVEEEQRGKEWREGREGRKT